MVRNCAAGAAPHGAGSHVAPQPRPGLGPPAAADRGALFDSRERERVRERRREEERERGREGEGEGERVRELSLSRGAQAAKRASTGPNDGPRQTADRRRVHRHSVVKRWTERLSLSLSLSLSRSSGREAERPAQPAGGDGRSARLPGSRREPSRCGPGRQHGRRRRDAGGHAAAVSPWGALAPRDTPGGGGGRAARRAGAAAADAGRSAAAAAAWDERKPAAALICSFLQGSRICFHDSLFLQGS